MKRSRFRKSIPKLICTFGSQQWNSHVNAICKGPYSHNLVTTSIPETSLCCAVTPSASANQPPCLCCISKTFRVKHPRRLYLATHQCTPLLLFTSHCEIDTSDEHQCALQHASVVTSSQTSRCYIPPTQIAQILRLLSTHLTGVQ